MIRLTPITISNRQEVLKLTLRDDQKTYIETVEDCLKEANELSLWRPVGIYDDAQLIGFAMYGLWKNEGKKGRVWLDRFLIDQRFQGKGYGKKAFIALCNHIFNTYHCHTIYLSLYEDNKVALALYKKIGFKCNGEKDIYGELVMVLNRDCKLH